MTEPALTHRPIMVDEVLEHLRPAPGEIAIDCTLGGGGHAVAILERLQPGGRLIGIDVDSVERRRTEARVRALGYGPETFVTHGGSFARLPEILVTERVARADVVFVDLGVSSMQSDDPKRGFSFRIDGPLDMRMDPSSGESAFELLARVSDDDLARLLVANADEPRAEIIARALKRASPKSTQALDRTVRAALTASTPSVTKPELKLAVRRTLQALRIAVNDEMAALDALLASLPHVLAPGGRVAIITFHSGEDRRVKKAFQAGLRSGVYSAIAKDVVRSAKDETRSNRRASSAKLRWARLR